MLTGAHVDSAACLSRKALTAWSTASCSASALGKPDKEASAMDSSPEAASNVSDRISTNYVL